FTEYAQQFQTLIKVAPPGRPYPNNVFKTVEIALDPITDDFPIANRLMAFVSHCAPERLPMGFIEAAFRIEKDLDQVIAQMRRPSLLKYELFPDGIAAVTVHPVVQAVGRARALEAGLTNWAIGQLVQVLRVYPPDPWNEPESWPVCEELNPHIFAIRSAGTAP